MAVSRGTRLYTLLQRELQEYRLSLLLTPLLITAVLSVLLLGSVLLAGRITAMGDAVLEVITAEGRFGPVITINIDSDDEADSVQPPAPPLPPAPLEYTIAPESPAADEAWEFSREWRFTPRDDDDEPKEITRAEPAGSLDPVMNIIHTLFLVVLIITSVNYLLSCMFQDRRDRSILFWKSMPVSEWEEVLVRLGVALLVAPAVYIAASLLMQVIFALLAMLLVWRMDMDPFVQVLGNIHFGSLLWQQVGGWLLTALWVAPVYAYLMLASAWARRSPFLAAITPVLALLLAEAVLLGSDYVATAIGNHLPHYVGDASAVAFYYHPQFYQGVNLVSLLSGLAFAALAVIASVYLRRHRFEI